MRTVTLTSISAMALMSRPLPNMLIFLPKILCSNSHTFTYFSLTLYRLCSKSFSLFSIQNTLKYTQIHSNILKYTPDTLCTLGVIVLKHDRCFNVVFLTTCLSVTEAVSKNRKKLVLLQQKGNLTTTGPVG